MTTLLIMRTHRILLFSLAAVLIASLMAPMMGAATTDLAIGDAAVVSNNGNGANLRTSSTDLSDDTISAEVPDGVIVYVADGPFVNEGRTWLWVETDLYGGGFISADLLVKRAETEEAAPAEPEAPAVVSNLAWLEPIDSGVVVDNYAELGDNGLPVLNDASYGAGVLGYAQTGAWFDVTSERVWVGDANFVRVNFNGAGAYVDGRFIALSSEAVVEEPTEEVIWIDEPTEEVVEQPSEEVVDVPTEENIEVPTDEVAEVPSEEVTEVPSEEVTEVPSEEVTEVPTEDNAEVPASPESDDEATEQVEDEVVTEEEAPVEEAAPVVVASTANTFDPTTAIGSATVTGTIDGLVCRAAADPAAPVLMTLAEGTKVQVFAEAVNGYLGIDCAGLQGFADVNYLWSGGAGDGEITAAQMTIVVTGTGSSLNCRTDASLSAGIITSLPDGTVLTTRGAASNGWTPVICGGKNGFVSTTWVEVKSGSNNSGNNSTGNTGTATVNTGGDGLYCRTGAGSSYGIITTLRHGSSVAVRGAQQGSWLPVTCAGQAGFVHTDYVNVSSGSGTGTTDPGNGNGTSTPTGTVTIVNTGGQRLNCRSGAGTSYGVITSLALGQTVPTRSGSVSGWTAVVCGGQNGFVSSDFVSGSTGNGTTDPGNGNGNGTTNPGGLAVNDHAKATANVNLRYQATTSSGVAVLIPQGTVILITGAVSNSFYPVDYDGLKGFVHQDYLSKTSDALSKRGGSGTPGTTDPGTGNGSTNPNGNAMVNYAMRYIGYPYVWNTRGPGSFDCSGFTYWIVLNVLGKNIGGGTWTQVAAGTPVSRNALQPGDLVFFQNTYTAGLSHVGMYIGNGQFIHAQNEATGVVISDLNSSYYAPRWYGAVRL